MLRFMNARFERTYEINVSTFFRNFLDVASVSADFAGFEGSSGKWHNRMNSFFEG